ncbi:MAG: selenium metabolism-associated LysR family transcriptional regulator [Thermodesulfobacteriota bacterium]
MDIHHLRIFCEVYRNKSFSLASQKLHITQPTVSAHIKNLEQELEVRLFDRLGQSIMPTDEARVLFPLAEQVLESLAVLMVEFSRISGSTKGKLLIGASTIPGTYLLPSALAAFRRDLPGISFEIRIGDSQQIAEQVAGHELLLGVVGDLFDQEQLSCREMYEDRMILAGDRKIWQLAQGRAAAKVLTGIPFLLREQGSGSRRKMEAYLQALGLPLERLDVTATLGSTAAVKEAMKNGLGASILSRIAIREELDRGELFEIPLPGLPIRRHFFIISHKRRTLPNPYALLAGFLQTFWPGTQNTPR